MIFESPLLITDPLNPLLIYSCSYSAFSLLRYSFIKYIKISPKIKTPPQKPRPAAVCSLVSPFTMSVMINPRRNPPKLPQANNNPTADPSPTGNTNSQPSYNIIGTKGIKKKELKAEIKLARARVYVIRKG